MAKANAGSEQSRIYILVGLLVVLAGIWLFNSLERGSGDRARAKKDNLDYARKDLPALLDVELQSSGTDTPGDYRSPFTFGQPPTPTPNLTPQPTSTPRGPRPTPPPRPTPTPTPRGWKGPPPPFDRAFLGHFGPQQLQVAAFRSKDVPKDGIAEVEVAVAGDVLEDSRGKPMFIIREIGLESVTIGFVGYDPSEEEIVPLAED